MFYSFFAYRFRQHRAIKIWRPTTELSGIYRCKVSSFVDEDFMQRKMIVYCKYFHLKITMNVQGQFLKVEKGGRSQIIH